jgi:uncharacterized protein (TIGR00251 family)
MRLQAKVMPNSRTEEVRQKGDTLLVRVKEPPREGKANAAVVKAVAKHFGVSPRSVRILSGHASRNKIIEIPKLDRSN